MGCVPSAATKKVLSSSQNTSEVLNIEDKFDLLNTELKRLQNELVKRKKESREEFSSQKGFARDRGSVSYDTPNVKSAGSSGRLSRVVLTDTLLMTELARLRRENDHLSSRLQELRNEMQRQMWQAEDWSVKDTGREESKENPSQ